MAMTRAGQHLVLVCSPRLPAFIEENFEQLPWHDEVPHE